MKVLVIDIETTGFFKDGGHIVEIGAVSLDTSTGKKKLVLDSLCREKAMADQELAKAWIIENSTLTVEEVEAAPKFKKVKKKLQKLINKHDKVTAFNDAFDFQYLRDRGLVIPNTLACPMKLSTPIMKLPNKHRKGQFKWPSVEEAYKFYLGEEIVEDHRGGSDALYEAGIILEMFKKGYYTESNG